MNPPPPMLPASGHVTARADAKLGCAVVDARGGQQARAKQREKHQGPEPCVHHQTSRNSAKGRSMLFCQTVRPITPILRIFYSKSSGSA
jgi:hypothetical protein